MKSKADQKEIGFLHHVHGGVKAIIEKSYTSGHMKPNGCSIYLWANKQDDLNPFNQPLAVIAGCGFLRCTTVVDKEVLSFEDALIRIKQKPQD